jgi:NitT/TauT family transport system substrate-binding protein
MITRRRTLQLFGASGVLALERPHIARAADMDEVQIATPATISDAPLFIAEHKGYWAEQKITAKLVNMQTGPQMIAPLGAGQIDVAAAATSAGLFNAAARGIGIKIVADKGSNQPGYSFVALLVRKELVDAGKFKTMKDLKGLKVAEPGKGGSTGSTVNQALKSAGLSYDDVDHVILGFPEMLTGMENGAIDAAILPEPFNTFGRNKGIGVRFSSDAFYPRQTIAVVLYGNDFMAKRQEVAQRFMMAYLKAARFYNGAIKDGHFAGANAPEVIDILTKETRYKDAALYKDVVPNGCDPDGRIDVPSIETDLAFWREQKYVEGDPKVADVVDNSYIEAALKVLGPYRAS